MKPADEIELAPGNSDEEEKLPARARDVLAAFQQGRRIPSPHARQRPTFLYYPSLPTQYFFDELPPWARLLEENWRTIRQV